jgi:AraC-like DNA-binding protein
VLHDVPPVLEDIQLRLSGLLSMLRWMTVPDLRPTSAAFQFREPGDQAEYERVFGCPIEWNHAPSELWFDASELVPSKDGASKIYAAAANFWERRNVRYPAAERSLIEQIENIVESVLEQGEIGIKFAAPRVGMSERTLIRKLREAGTTYRAIVERLRRDKAVELLQDRRLSLKQIAAALGYSNEQNFARAFQRWFGTSPGDARKGVALKAALH